MGATAMDIVGGATTAEVESSKVSKTVELGVQALQAQSNSMYALLPTRVYNATQQVVAGVKYDVIVGIGLSEKCLYKVGRDFNTPECTVKQGSVAKYEIIAVEQAWATPRWNLVSVQKLQDA